MGQDAASSLCSFRLIGHRASHAGHAVELYILFHCIDEDPDLSFALAHAYPVGTDVLRYASVIYFFESIAILETNVDSEQWGGFADKAGVEPLELPAAPASLLGSWG